ncbi:reverse transcriptase [Fusarium beomiforme]|uniref:Reverse transcriptase n=1 Tax=Fusarium beomiforme TaxID=44412 RepID=A0A9P5AHD2_9HYPO|nr:reverse transcriptase [Fusarium beomiforme]
MIAKPGRRDLTSPRAWRPVSLLSCLGKGLERLIARRLAWAAVHYGVLHPQQAGVLPKRSAADLVTALVHDIEEAFARKKVTTLVTTSNALSTPSCATDWSCASISRHYHPLCTSSMRPTPRFTGVAHPKTTAAASTSIDEMVRWGAANGVSFDPKKTELMHFSRRKLRTAPAVRHGDVEKRPEPALRWLGIWLDSRFSARLKSLDDTHSLVRRTAPPRQPTYHDLIKRKYQAQAESSFRTRLRRTDELLGQCVRPKLIQKRFQQEQMPPLQTESKEKTVEAFLHWDNTPIFDGSGRLGPAEVFDAEATGALEGLKAALNLRELATQNIYICLDNLAAATCLRGTLSDSSQDVFLEFQALVTSHGAIQARWVPGHSDIPGNERADKLAKAASLLPEPEGAKPTLAYLRRIARQKPKEALEAWWSASAPEQYRRLNLMATTGCPSELSLPRAALHHLLAARSLHGDFAAYHEKFDHVNARLKSTAALSSEALTLTEYSSQFSNGKRLHQIHRPVQGQRVLWKDMPSLLGDDDQRSTRISLSLFIFYSSPLFNLSLSLLPVLGQTKGEPAPFIWP